MAMMRKLLLLPAIVAPLPLMVIGVVITGRPLAPRPGAVLFADVSEYVQPGARLTPPPPPAFAAAIAATSPAAPPPAPEQGTLPECAPRAAPPTAASAMHATTAADMLACRRNP